VLPRPCSATEAPTRPISACWIAAIAEVTGGPTGIGQCGAVTQMGAARCIRITYIYSARIIQLYLSRYDSYYPDTARKIRVFYFLKICMAGVSNYLLAYGYVGVRSFYVSATATRSRPVSTIYRKRCIMDLCLEMLVHLPNECCKSVNSAAGVILRVQGDPQGCV
jgi:hypothetical protein